VQSRLRRAAPLSNEAAGTSRQEIAKMSEPKMSEPKVFRFAEQPRVSRGSGVMSVPLCSRHTGCQSFTTGITEFPPGARIAEHYHNVEESVVIIEGEGHCNINGTEYRLSTFDTTYIPAGVPHYFWNSSNRPMKILWIYGGTHVTRTFVATGQTVEHLTSADRAVISPGT
jgi:quercetin dioxygenase-like cupin family protein